MSPPRRSCIFPGCHSVQGNGFVSLFRFPLDNNVRKRWINFVKRSYCGEFKITNNTRLCHVHFTPDSYSNYHQVKSRFLKSPLTLVSMAEPTLSVPGLHPTVPLTAGAPITATGIMCPPESSPPTSREAACQCGDVKKNTREIGCQTDRVVGKRTVATQLSKIILVNRYSTGFPADVPDPVSCKHGLKLQDHIHIKKEEEELWERLEEKQETDITVVTVKSEEEEKEAQCSLLHWRLSEENIKGEPATCSSTKLMKVEPNGDISEGPEAANTCRQQDSDGEETDCSDTEDSEDWREPLSQSEAQSEHMDMSCEGFQTSENNTKGTPHNREKPHGCDMCGKRFGNKADLKIHRRIHTGEKPYGCEICGKTFIEKKKLKRHMMVHTGEKPFSCDVCGRQFPHNANLKKHMRVHTGEKPFSCDICSKRFRQKVHLKSHMIVHTK
ncbi:zinc finger and SCAN domain-containing protein 21-like isoform X2 [Gouania willdenowi]|uniref:zinc finger and SCAN domain-containing protein 21-like isoform X2 n=1 Tax=Gouania willdenowi TaxID=441366 RepID=UPI001055CD8D|nr:zinc finger and SCAN domain-containing protein 21-like isoform X2 [Gouania willdenowi]